MSTGRLRSFVLSLLAGTLVALLPRAASATQKFGPIQLSGNLQSQNLFRTPEASEVQFIQQRNTAHIRFDYDWLQGGKFYGKYDVPFIESSHLFILYRGVYDSVYDTTPGFAAREDIHGKAYFDGTDFLTYKQFGQQVQGLPQDTFELSGLSHEERNSLKFDNQLREAYIDVKFRVIPLTARLGRQQIVWGETDNFRMLDRANALDLTWHLQQEIPAPAFGWDEIRRPYWMLKFLYDLGNVGPLSQSFLEWYWNPGDWRPAKQTYLPRPWGLPFMNPFTNPVDGVFNGGVCAPAPGGRCTRLMNDTKLFDKGDWSRNPFDNSQVGVRYHGITPQGLEFSLVYYYQRWAGDDGTNYAPLQGLNLPGNKQPGNAAAQAERDRLVQEGIFPAQFIAPYVHTIGGSANYSDETFTQTVFRFETVYDVGVPFFDLGRDRVTVIDNPALPGVRKKNMFKGMIAFDRPTWIRTLNKKSTIFLTGQFFWHYLVNNPDCQAQVVAQTPRAQRPKSCLVGGLDLPGNPPRNSPQTAFRDKIRNWETLATFAAFTFYRGGSIVPLVGFALDATNQWNMEPFWMVDYVVRDDFVINLAQRYFVTPKGHSTPIFETWGLAGFNAGRSETSLRLTYQF